MRLYKQSEMETQQEAYDVLLNFFVKYVSDSFEFFSRRLDFDGLDLVKFKNGDPQQFGQILDVLLEDYIFSDIFMCWDYGIVGENIHSGVFKIDDKYIAVSGKFSPIRPEDVRFVEQYQKPVAAYRLIN